MNRNVPTVPRTLPFETLGSPSGDRRWDHQGRRLCRGVLRRARTPCRNPALTGRDHCALHGGRSRMGAAHPNFRHGRYSRALGNTPLSDSFEIWRIDPELISMREHIAAWDARIEELFGRLGPNSQASWEQAIAQYRAWRQLHGVEGMEAQALAAQQVFERSLSEGASAEQAWSTLLQMGEAVRKVREAEFKREVAMGMILSVANAQAFAAALSHLAKQFVPAWRLGEFVQAVRLLTLHGIDTRQKPGRPETRAGN